MSIHTERSYDTRSENIDPCISQLMDEYETRAESDTECKVFVGNVPYQCTQEEFDNCFSDVDGFIKAEIITVHKTDTSRGFGFVTLRTHHDAEKLKCRTDITFKGRVLRFTPYQNESPKSHLEPHNSYVYVDKIPTGKDRVWLRSMFSSYEPIGKFFIFVNHENGEKKNSGLIEVLDESKYREIIAKRWHEVDGVTLETTRYKARPSRFASEYESTVDRPDIAEPVDYKKKIDRFSLTLTRNVKVVKSIEDQIKIKKINKNDLYTAFMAGKNMGWIQGVNQGIKIANSTSR